MPHSNGSLNVLGIKDVAANLKVKEASVRTFNNTAEMHRRRAAETGDQNHIQPADMPKPDGYLGQSPYWFPESIEEWKKRRDERPGRGGHNKEAAKQNLAAAGNA